MFPKNIPNYKLDLTGKNSDNRVYQEYYRRTDVESETVFVLRTGPFYTESLILTKPTGEVLVEGTDYELLGIAGQLTAFVKNKEVGMFIYLTNPAITEWFAEYQVVGHFSILNQDLINLIEGALNDDRPIFYRNIKNKPLWFNPELHQHDIRYEIHSFGDLIDCIKRIKDVKGIFKERNAVSIDQFQSVILSRIESYETMLLNYIRQHNSEDITPFVNDHGLTAEQVELEKVDNFDTASLLDVLDGFRRDLHVTADTLKRVVDSIGKETDELVKFGTIPILRYGSNSFIPTPVQGSYEGLGGNNFYVGLNTETNGDALMLMNRNDGRVNGLYFMTNTVPNHAPSGWTFTSFQYTHQTAEYDGVKLRDIIRGSNGKFLIVGGPDNSGKQVWYYTFGNGTFNPLKHKLIKFPDTVDVQKYSLLCTEGYPDRIYLFTHYDQLTCYNNETYRSQGFDLPAGYTYDPANGVIFYSYFCGFKGWEFNISDQTWRPITYTYNQAGEKTQIVSDMYMPFRTIVEEQTARDTREDGNTNYKYGLRQFEYSFLRLITFWNIKSWHNTLLGRYDATTGNMYLKFIYSGYGNDDRIAIMEGGNCSIGFVLKNRSINGSGGVSYTVENRKSLDEIYTVDTAQLGSWSGSTAVIGWGTTNPHAEWVLVSYAGEKTIMWFDSTKVFSIGSSNYGSFPADIAQVDLVGQYCLSSYDNWIDYAMNYKLSQANVAVTTYNEENPVGFFIGPHSASWIQLDPNDYKTYGAIYVGRRSANYLTQLWFRKHPVLNAAGYPEPPTNHYSLYEKLDGYGLDTIGYGLENVTYPIYNDINTCFVTNIFYPSSDNRKSEYSKHLVGHQSFPEDNTYVTNDTASTTVGVEWEMVKNRDGYKVVATKQYNLDSAIKDTLIPYMKNNYKNAVAPTVGADSWNNKSISFENALATMRIGFTNIRSAKYEQLMILSFLGFVNEPSNKNLPENCRVYVLSQAFSLTGGSADSSGVIQGASVAPVGLLHSTYVTIARTNVISDYATAGYRFGNNRGSTTIVQPRDLVHQFSNGLSFVNLQWGFVIPILNNSYFPSVSYLVSENGITETQEFTAYWTAGEYFWFHHPYYGCINRKNQNGYSARPAGPSQVGFRYNKDFTTFSDQNLIYDNWVMGNSNYLDSAFSIYFSTTQEVLIGGNSYQMGVKVVELHDVVKDPTNKTFYAYLTYGDSGPEYRVTVTPLSETPSQALIAIIKTNNDSIYQIESYNVFSMNGVRISTVKHGSVIPAASGIIDADGQLENWVTKSR